MVLHVTVSDFIQGQNYNASLKLSITLAKYWYFNTIF